MQNFSYILSNLRIVEIGGWNDVILNIKDIPKTFFVEGGASADPILRLNSLINLYSHRENPFSYFKNIPAQKKRSFPIDPNTNIHTLVDQVCDQLSKDESIQRHISKIKVIFEEMAMNGVRSSIKSLAKNGTPANGANPSAEMHLVWDNASLWVHCLDDLGAFKKKFLPGSFKEYDGSQGFGMKLIFESANDLFISSIPDKQTWFAARIGTYLSNLKYDREHKALCLDCPYE